MAWTLEGSLSCGEPSSYWWEGEGGAWPYERQMHRRRNRLLTLEGLWFLCHKAVSVCFPSKLEVEPELGLDKTASIRYLARDSFLPKTSCAPPHPQAERFPPQAELALFL